MTRRGAVGADPLGPGFGGGTEIGVGDGGDVTTAGGRLWLTVSTTDPVDIPPLK